MTLPLAYDSPPRDSRLRGHRLAAFILLLIAGSVWLALTALFVVSVASLLLFFSTPGGGYSLRGSEWLMVAGEMSVPMIFTMAYFAGAIGLLRRPRRGAITSMVTVCLNALLPLAAITLSIVDMLPASDPGDLVPFLILVMLSISTLGYLAILLVLLKKSLHPAAAAADPVAPSVDGPALAPEAPAPGDSSS